MLMAQTCALLGFACYAVVLTTLQDEWHLSNLQSGLIASAFFFGYMLMVPLATALTDRVDAKKVYLVGGLLRLLDCWVWGSLPTTSGLP